MSGRGSRRGWKGPPRSIGEGSQEGSLLSLSLNVSPCVSYGLWFCHTTRCIQCSSVSCVGCKSDFDPKGLACWGPASTRQTCLDAPWCELLPKPEIAFHNFSILGRDLSETKLGLVVKSNSAIYSLPLQFTLNIYIYVFILGHTYHYIHM